MTETKKDLQKRGTLGKGRVKPPNLIYYIFQLVRALWLVNLAGFTLLYGPLK